MAMFFMMPLLYALLQYSSAHTYYMDHLPNGNSVPHPCGGNRVWQGLGHHYPEGAKGTGGVRNAFGIDFKEAGFTWTRDLCMKDSDMDGRTNGEEMGDPNCTWTKGAQPRYRASSHPGICDPVESSHCQQRNVRFGDRINCTSLNEKPCSALSEPSVIHRDVRFPLSQIPNQVTSYTCMVYDLPTDGDYHLVATTPIVNNTDIVHHIILFGCDFPDNFNNTLLTMMKAAPYTCDMTPHHHCQQFLSTWTYGFKDDCLSRDAGFRIGQHGTRIAALQIHWNNPKMLSGQTDSSGLTLYYSSTRRPNDASVFLVGQQYLDIPPGTDGLTFSATCPGKCTREMFKEKIYITRAANHMHYYGRKQRISLYRNGTKVRDLTNEENYHYDMPVFHHFDPPMEVLPGDDIVTECTYSSDPRRKVVYGAGTHNEMCFGFLTYYPVQEFLQTLCVSWKTVQRCVRKLPKFQGIYEDCDMRRFEQESKAILARTFSNESCGSYFYNKQCNDKCIADSKNLVQHPCLKGDLGEFLNFQHDLHLGVLRGCARIAASSSSSIENSVFSSFILCIVFSSFYMI